MRRIKAGADKEAVVVGRGTVRAIRSAEKTNIGLIQERLGEKLIRGEARYCDREAKRLSFQFSLQPPTNPDGKCRGQTDFW